MKKKQLFELYKKNSLYILNAKPGIEAKKQKKIASQIINKLTCHNKNTEELLFNVERIHRLVNELLSLSNIRIEQHSKYTIDGLINELSKVSFNNKISFVTILGTPKDESKQKDEIVIFDIVNDMLKKIADRVDVTWEYTIVLSLHSEELKSENGGVGNQECIQPYTSVPVMYPSDFFKTKLLRDTNEQEKTLINSRIDRYINNHTIKKDFSVANQRIIKNVKDYATFGKLFEKSNLPVVLIDLQKRIFPYQQPCYQLIRNNPLPVIPMQKLINELIYK